VILSTIHKSVVTSKPVVNLGGLQPCSHEKADTRILFHVKDAMNSGYKDAIIRTVDTDVVVLAVAYFQDLENIGNLWIAFGTGKDFRYIPVHELARSIGSDRFAMSGCDTTSQFANHGKKSAWTTWLASPKITETFISLSKQTSPELPEDIIDKLERYIVLLYSPTSDDKSVDSARLYLFCQMSRPIDNIPPTRAALQEHTRRSTVDLSGNIASKSVRTLRLHLTGDGRRMVPSSNPNEQCYQ